MAHALCGTVTTGTRAHRAELFDGSSRAATSASTGSRTAATSAMAALASPRAQPCVPAVRTPVHRIHQRVVRAQRRVGARRRPSACTVARLLRSIEQLVARPCAHGRRRAAPARRRPRRCAVVLVSTSASDPPPPSSFLERLNATRPRHRDRHRLWTLATGAPATAPRRARARRAPRSHLGARPRAQPASTSIVIAEAHRRRAAPRAARSARPRARRRRAPRRRARPSAATRIGQRRTRQAGAASCAATSPRRAPRSTAAPSAARRRRASVVIA